MRSDDKTNLAESEPDQAAPPAPQVESPLPAAPDSVVRAGRSEQKSAGRPRWRRATLLLLLVGTVWGSVYLLRHWRRSVALGALPTVDTSRLQSDMAEIITETRDAVLSAPTSGQAWGRYGSVLLAQEFVAEAVTCYARAEQLDPTEVRWPYLRGLCLERQEPEAALACFRRATQVRDSVALPKVQLAETLLSQGQLDEAEIQLRRAALTAPTDPRLLLNKGRLAFLRGQLDEALRWATQAAQLDTGRRRIRLLICQIQQQRGDQKAVEEQLRILETIPETGYENEWPDPYLAEIVKYKRGTQWTLQLAQEQIFAGRISDAVSLLLRAGGRDSDDVRIIVLLGKAYLRNEDTENAADTLARALEKDPSYAPVHFELGNLALVTGRRNEAAEHYREVIRIQPSFASAHYNLGLYHRQRAERDEAIAAFEQACHYMPQNYPAQRELAELLLEAGRRDDAWEHLRIAARLAPTDPKTQSLLQEAQAGQ